MIRLKRIKNKSDLKDVLRYLIEDVNTFNFLSNRKDISDGLSSIVNKLGDT